MVNETNRFEVAARHAKVVKMLMALPPATTREEIEAQAAELARWDDACRREWARAAGCLPPSDSTWALFVAAARGRRTLGEALARVAQNDNAQGAL